MKSIGTMLRSVMVLFAVIALSPAMTKADAMSDLQARFKERLPQVTAAKQAGTIGETAAGYMEFVKGEASADAAAKQLVTAENNDRKELYKLIAAKENTTPEKVAILNAQRNFGKAKPGEWLKGPDGQWKQKA